MNDQRGFFDGDNLPPHQRHSSTSRDAARQIEPRAGILRRAVLDWLRVQGGHGGTDEEGIIETGIPASTYRPRRVELVKGGLVEDSGRERRTASGRKAVVWVAVFGGNGATEEGGDGQTGTERAPQVQAAVLRPE